MFANFKTDEGATELRKRAEKIARGKATQLPQNMEALSPEKIQHAFDELQAHQIELEIQNEEMRRAQAELDAARAHYFDLYDMAPIGYFTLSEKGLILEANLTSTAMLGVARGAMVMQPLSSFILKEDQDIYYLYRKQLFETGMPQGCELRMVKMNNTEFWVRLEATLAMDMEGAPVCRAVMSDITKRKDVDDALSENQKLLLAVMNGTSDPVYVKDRASHIVMANEALAKVAGKPLEEIIGRTDSEYYGDAAGGQMLREHDLKIMASGRSDTMEEMIPSPTGSRFFISNKAPYRNTFGDIIGVIGISRDITERKQMEHAPCDSEEKFRLIADTMPLLVWTAEPNGKVDYVNSFYQNYSGMRSETANQIYDLIHPDDLKRGEAARYHSIITGEIYEVEHRARRYDGVYRWFLTRGLPVCDEKGDIIKWYGTSTDIHDLRELKEELELKVKARTALLADTNKALLDEIVKRRRIAEELRKSEETFRLLFELNLAGVFRSMLDPVTYEIKRIDCNEAYAQILGYSREEILTGGTPSTFFSKNDRGRYLKRLIKKKKLTNYETRRWRKNGKPVWIITNASLREIEGSENLLFEGTIIDITDRKIAEEQMRSAHRNLRAMASQVVATEEQERQYIATVLHDTVAQTLAAAKMQFEVLQEHVSSDGLKFMAETRHLIAESIQQTRSIMADLSPPILYELGFIPALEGLVEQISGKHGIHIKFDNTHEIELLPHDTEVLLYTAIRELLMNIVKHAKANNATVRISGKAGKVQIEVSNNGVGIDKSKIGYHENLSGGFGLFSIQERLKHFGGVLDIQSQRGKGTKITMITPQEGMSARKWRRKVIT
jgi:PAS domain S-box-containing protein